MPDGPPLLNRSASWLATAGAALLGLLPTGPALAQDGPGWDERLARRISDRLKVIDREAADLAGRLGGLPQVPENDQGGTGGYAGLRYRAAGGDGKPCSVEVRWQDAEPVELVVLVPARRYDTQGLDAQYGTPDEFAVELLDAAGQPVAVVARESGTRAHPVRRGHPFVFPLAPPVVASGLRITATRLLPNRVVDPETEGSLAHAWAEVFAFAGDRNLALGGEVKSAGAASPSSPWHWKPAFLVDGQTPLGLPEIPDPEHGNIGWISEGRASATESAAITVDLGQTETFDAVRLLPAKRPTSDLPSGFGFPRRFAITVSETGATDTWREILNRDMRNPGHNPVLASFGETNARYVRIQATELWKEFEEYPAFFALSEVEVLAGGRNLALGKAVSSPDGMSNVIASTGRIWSSAALCDGFGADGRLVSSRAWLEALNQRLTIETRLHELRLESARLIQHWRQVGLAGFAALGLLAALLAIVAPIRYRRHARRELLKVRERIAGDLHDEVGSNLGSVQMLADLAAGRSGPSEELKRIQRIAAETVSAVRDIVWLLRPEGEHRIGTVEHLRETSSIMLEGLDWKFTANEAAWQIEMPDEDTRHLFLFFREALHNIIRHARATKVEVRVEGESNAFRLAVHDDGAGIAPERLVRPATLHALRQRAEALGAEFAVESEVGGGTRLSLVISLPRKPRGTSR
jgi:signal transduction histidine kinase